MKRKVIILIGILIFLLLVLFIFLNKFLKEDYLTKPFLEDEFISQVTFDGKEVLFAEKVDSSLLAGMVLLINDSILIDRSGKARLEKLFK